ncbi:Ethanolaminephosphotransferase 1 [Frankliniella fusca]|uniref:Ethanolaminephosphotransferase 1 n=1 Tax=Frankliniella fusca TaxID=407009 RepID=A0AAE1HUQ8_9NEOP|nr:Ethanolaminephosphotransferase 1 [Frankliniella fusca]
MGNFKLLDYEYLSPQQLAGFETYKYSSIDSSPIGKYITHPFWNFVVKFCPTWIAPNVLTFSGFLLIVLNFVMFAYYDPNFNASSINKPDAPIPRWVFLLAGINLFLAHTLDGIDGKQARRTGTSGPLGELFDHGCDSWSSAMIPVCLYSAFGSSDLTTFRMFFCVWNVFINFYTSHWEKYNTGVLFLPWGYDGAMIVVIFLLTITGIFGHEIWYFSLWNGFTASHLFEFLFYFSALVTNVPVVLWNIYVSYRDRTGKMRPFVEAVRPLFPILLLTAISTIWVTQSPNDIVSTDARIMILLVGTLFSNICSRLIVAYMSNQRCDAFNLLLIPLSVVVACVWLLPANRSLLVEEGLLYLLTIFIVCAHIHYGTCIVRQMCRHFHIDCFHIRQHSE